MSGMDEIRQTFFIEAEDLLGELESGLSTLRDSGDDLETVNAIFRAVHSIKGGAGMFELTALVDFAHVFETVLDNLRSRRIGLTDAGLKLMFKSADTLADLVKAARDGEDAGQERVAQLSAELAVLAEGDGVQATAPAAAEAPEAGGRGRFRVDFAAHAALYAKGHEPARLFSELGRIGETRVECDVSAVPPLAELDPEGAYLRWTIDIETEASEQTVRDVFEFVDGDCDLEVVAVEAPAEEMSAAIEEDGFDVAALLARIQAEIGGDAAPAEAAFPAGVEAAPEPAAAVAELDQARQSRQAEVQRAARDDDSKPAAGAPAAGGTIRVDLDRLDRLVNLVGELVINRAVVAQRVAEAGLAGGGPVSVGLDELEQLTREIQDNVMALRAQPVKSVFQRMSRLARETGDMTGKSVHLIVEGENTEVDKTIVERLTDPLTHMIRNAIDHGLETPEKRIAAGKPPTGTVHLSARHASGYIVIEVADDGNGLDRARVRDTAIRKGLIPADAQLTDEETDNLIFMPGFSTASSISNISGRGVGLDVVKRSVQALGGRISISSRPGKGSTFALSLPLTLAVLDGMVVTVADQMLVLPLTATMETLQPKPEEVHCFGGSSRLIAMRDGFTPVIDVGRQLGYRGELADLSGCVGILVESQGNTRTVLLVDSIHGQRQVVIKSLAANYGSVPGIAAATILGDGRVALILDVDALVGEAATASASEPAPLQAAG